jgi:hypothetical protein
MEIEHQLDESITSNLSLPLMTSNILNPPKNETFYEPHNVHCSSISKEDGNKEEKLTSSYIIPERNKTMGSTIRKKYCGSKSNHHHSSKKHRFRTLLRRRSWPNPFVQGG